MSHCPSHQRTQTPLELPDRFLVIYGHVIQLVGVLLVSLLFFLFLRKRWAAASRLPPEAAGAWTLVGHLGIVLGRKPLHRTFSALAEKHGPIFSLRVGRRPVVVVGSMQLAKECLTTNDRALAGRPSLLSTRLLCFGDTMFALAPHGNLWKGLRKIAVTELLSNRQLDLHKKLRIEEINSFVTTLYRRSVGDRPVNISRLLFLLTMNTITRMVSGKQYDDLDANQCSEEERELSKLIEDSFCLLGLFTVSDVLPWLEWLDLGGHVKALKKVERKMDEIGTAWLEEHRQRRRNSGNDEAVSGGNQRDFIDVLLDQVDDHKFPDHDIDTIIKATALDVVGAGADTTSTMLVWALSLLTNNRHVLRKAQDELDVHVGKERQVEESDIWNLPYLQAIIKESMRLYPVSPLLIPHQAMEPATIGGYHLPVGTIVYINTWRVQRDPALWPDPEAFKPERHLEVSRDVLSGQNFDLIPFSSGWRSCPGSFLATRLTHLVLARIVHGFNWTTPGDGPVDMTEGFGMTMPKVTPLHVFLTPRLPNHVYDRS